VTRVAGESNREAEVDQARTEPAVSPTLKLAVRNLRVDYVHPITRLPFCAVGDVSFDVHAGQIVSIVGPSGCGKSTLLSTIAGLRKAQEGTIWFARSGSGVERRAVVFQKAALLPWRTAVQNVAYPLLLAGVKRKPARERAAAALDRVGLANFLDHHPHQLSGGMQQRVNLARALVTEPELLLLDEPFAAVDAQMREILQEELLGLLRSTSMTGIFVTHQIDEAVLMGDQVIVLSSGPASTVKTTVQVPLPQPRSVNVRDEPQFRDIVREVWTAVKEEIMADLESH
jgi:NitT/TauT family transport system ATP-binding protein